MSSRMIGVACFSSALLSATTATAQCQPLFSTRLAAPDAAAGDGFGWDIAIDGDTAVIGSRWDDHAGGVDAGSAYVYTRGGGGAWTQSAWFTGSDTTAGDRFGWVAIDGETIIVGAPYHDLMGLTDAGAAYVFVRSGQTWSQQAKLTAPDAGAGDFFGAKVAVSGDTALVGANADDERRGAAYVFVRSGGTWTRQAKLTARDGAPGHRFGFAVGLEGDTALVGASQAFGFGAGCAYIFTRDQGAWTQRAKLTASDAANEDWFGQCVALSGNTAMAAAILADPGGIVDAGAVYVFQRPLGGWSDMTETQKLSASDARPEDVLGDRLTLDGNIALVGAAHRDHPTGGPDAGAAYVFVREGGVWTERAILTAPDPSPEDQLGQVALSGNTAFLGAVADDHAGGIDAGSAYVFELNCATCYPDCDTSTGRGTLDIFDFLCFQNRFDALDPYACDCDTSTGRGACDIFDFLCFQNAFAAGCP